MQDGSGAPATSLTCAEWTEAFELTHPVLIDPVFTTEAIAGDQGFPVHVVFGPSGDELYWEAGPFDAAEVENALTGS